MLAFPAALLACALAPPPATPYVFLRRADGKITGFARRREAWDLVWTRE